MTDRIKNMTPTAAQLACAVAEMDVPECHKILNKLTREQLQSVAVILAASVDLSKPFGEAVQIDRTDATQAAIYRLANTTAAHREVAVEAIYSASRTRDIAEARQIVCWLALAEGHSSVRIGTAIGRDHSTVLHAAEKVTATPELLSVARTIYDEMKGLAA